METIECCVLPFYACSLVFPSIGFGCEKCRLGGFGCENGILIDLGNILVISFEFLEQTQQYIRIILIIKLPLKSFNTEYIIWPFLSHQGSHFGGFGLMSTQLLVAWEGMGVYHSLATCEVLITIDKLFIKFTLKLLKSKNPMKLPNSLATHSRN